MTSPVRPYSADDERLERLLDILVENGFGLLSWEKPAVQKALMQGGEGSLLAEKLLKSARLEFTRREMEQFRERILLRPAAQGQSEGECYRILPEYFAPHVKEVINMLVEMLNRRE